ncbi:MAG: hypothetical protein V3U60_05060 [Gammaproteobacteria bacterium]|jgi:hypothetical protein
MLVMVSVAQLGEPENGIHPVNEFPGERLNKEVEAGGYRRHQSYAMDGRHKY